MKKRFFVLFFLIIAIVISFGIYSLINKNCKFDLTQNINTITMTISVKADSDNVLVVTNWISLAIKGSTQYKKDIIFLNNNYKKFIYTEVCINIDTGETKSLYKFLYGPNPGSQIKSNRQLNIKQSFEYVKNIYERLKKGKYLSYRVITDPESDLRTMKDKLLVTIDDLKVIMGKTK